MRMIPLLGLLACTTAAEPPNTSQIPPALQTAHQAWVDEDLNALTKAVHEVLTSEPAPHIVDNAVGLLDEAFRHHPELPSDQALPRGITQLSLDHIHAEHAGGPLYRLVVAAVTDTPDRITDIALDGPGVHAQRSDATWTVTPEESMYYVELELLERPEPPRHGLYTITLTMDGAPHTLWTVLGTDVATELPEITSPTAGQLLTTGTPTIAFRAPATPQHAPGERVGHGVWIARVPSWEPTWSTWSTSTDGMVPVTTELQDGRYSVSVSRRETRRLGPVDLGRIARRGIPFQVRTPAE